MSLYAYQQLVDQLLIDQQLVDQQLVDQQLVDQQLVDQLLVDQLAVPPSQLAGRKGPPAGDFTRLQFAISRKIVYFTSLRRIEHFFEQLVRHLQ